MEAKIIVIQATKGKSSLERKKMKDAILCILMNAPIVTASIA